MSSYQTTAISKFNLKNIFASNVDKSTGVSSTTDSPTNSSVLRKPSTPLPIFRDRINHKSQLIFPAIEKSSSQSSLIFSAPVKEQEYEKEALKDWLIGKQDLTVDSFIKKPQSGMNNNSNSLSSSIIQVAQRRQIRPSKFQTITCPDTSDSFDSIPRISTNNKPQSKQGNQGCIGDAKFIDPINNQQTKSSQVQKNYITGSGSLQVIRFSAAGEGASSNGKNEETIEVKNIISRRNNLRNSSIIIDESAKQVLRRTSIERTKQDESTLETVVQPSQHNRRPSIELQVEGELDISPLKKNRRNVQPSSCSDIQQFLGLSSNDMDNESPQPNRQLYYYRKPAFKTASNSKPNNSNINENSSTLPSINLSNHRVIIDAQNKDSPVNSNGSNYNSPMNGNNSNNNNNSFTNYNNSKPFNLTKSTFSSMNNNSFQLMNNSFQRESPKLPFGSDSRIPLPQTSSKQPLSMFGQYKQLQLSPFSQFPEYTKSQGMSSTLADVSFDEVNSIQDISLNKQLMHSRRSNRHLQAASVGGTATNISLSDQDLFRNSQSPKSILKASASKSRFFASANKKVVAFNEKVTQYDI